jgi:phosphoglycolate phosphatase-like HAD superfamily hydrolase
MTPPGVRRTLVIAVDGVLVPTLGPRADALHAAAAEVGLALTAREDHTWYAGRDWHEMARALSVGAPDETLVDLAALVAERRWRDALAAALPTVNADVVAQARAAMLDGWRVVLRADTSRRAGAMLFAVLVGETQCSRVVAGDDVRVAAPPPRALRASQSAVIGAAESIEAAD